MKKAILIASFGTTIASAIERMILPLTRDAARAFPQWDVRLCFTSQAILDRLTQQSIPISSLEQTLEALCCEGYQQVAILPTLLTDGGEYQKICAARDAFSSRFAQLTVAEPLLSRLEDRLAVAAYIRSAYPTNDCEALLLMGHGTMGSDNPSLQKLAVLLGDGQFLAALHGEPSFSQVLSLILEKDYRHVKLIPLMFTAGTHALRHLSGPSDASWESRCRTAGLETRCHLSGLGEASEIRKLYLSHLSASLSKN